MCNFFSFIKMDYYPVNHCLHLTREKLFWVFLANLLAVYWTLIYISVFQELRDIWNLLLKLKWHSGGVINVARTDIYLGIKQILNGCGWFVVPVWIPVIGNWSLSSPFVKLNLCIIETKNNSNSDSASCFPGHRRGPTKVW